MRLPSKSVERSHFRRGFQAVIGVDEVGMGCLAGPVVVCAVLFEPKFYSTQHKKLRGIRDSKLLLPHQREKYAKELMRDKSFRYQIVKVPVKRIDELNIYQAARWGMRMAITKLKVESEKLKVMVLVDGNTKIKNLDMEQRAIVKGDQKIFAIACASVIAKVYRDKLMVRLARKYPNYGLEQHKGYATAFHRQKIKEYGSSLIHRKSFVLLTRKT